MNNQLPPKKNRLSLSVSKGYELALHKLAPGRIYKQLEDSFLNPESKIIDKKKIPHGIKLFNLNTRNGTLQGYQLGHGPTVLLVHGWSGGAYQFFPLMNGLSRCGFNAVSFDHFGHGHSDKNHASIPEFISSVNAMLSHLKNTTQDGLAAIVGHSMGCTAIVNAPKKMINSIPLFFISPVFNFRTYFAKQLNLQHIYSKLSKQYQLKFEKDHLKKIDKIELKQKLADYSSDTLIIHDRNDHESKIIDSLNFCSAHPLTKLVAAKGYDHTRLIHAETVWQQLKSHLNYEDITSNRFSE